MSDASRVQRPAYRPDDDTDDSEDVGDVENDDDDHDDARVAQRRSDFQLGPVPAGSMVASA